MTSTPCAPGDLVRTYLCALEHFARILHNNYTARQQAGPEQDAVADALGRLARTMGVLNLKYGYRTDNSADMVRWVDVLGSGLPLESVVSELGIDMRAQERRIGRLASQETLRNMLLGALLANEAETPHVLALLAERAYYDKLTDDLFFTFVPGVIKRRDEVVAGRQGYVYHWLCYDHATNRPHVYVLYLEHQGESDAFANGSALYVQFEEAVQGEGRRAPAVGVVMRRLDEVLPKLGCYPKVLKRICFGPFFTPALAQLAQTTDLAGQATPTILEELQPSPYARLVGHRGVFHDLLTQVGARDDIVCFIADEVVFSSGEEQEETLWRSRIRQVLYIPEHDKELVERKASAVHMYVVLPHPVLVELQHAHPETLRALARIRKLAYTKEIAHEIA